jgi:FeS assembly SUF system protein
MASLEELKQQITDAISEVYDPEIPVNIYEMGLIYNIDIDEDSKDVTIDMTLTTPNCPSAQELPAEVQRAAETVEGVNQVLVDIVWDPPWEPSRMSEEAQLELGLI